MALRTVTDTIPGWFPEIVAEDYLVPQTPEDRSLQVSKHGGQSISPITPSPSAIDKVPVTIDADIHSPGPTTPTTARTGHLDLPYMLIVQPGAL